MSFLDKAFFIYPCWAVNFLNVASSIFTRADTLSNLKASDHVIISVTLSLKPSHPRSQRSLSTDLLKTSLFKSLFFLAMELHPWHISPLALLSRELNALIPEVANYVKSLLHSMYDFHTWDSLHKLVTRDQNALYMQHQYLNIASRLVWQNNVFFWPGNFFLIIMFLEIWLKFLMIKVCWNAITLFMDFQNAKHSSLQKSMASINKSISSNNPEKVQQKEYSKKTF